MSAIKDTTEQLAELRAEIVHLEEDRATTKGASVPRDEALDLIAETTEPNGDVAAALCWFFPELVREKLTAEIDRLLKEHPPGLATEDRPAALAEIDAAIRKLGVEEEQIITEAESAGIELERRAAADPAIVLTVTELEGQPPPKPQAKRPKAKTSTSGLTKMDKALNQIPKQSEAPTRV